MRLIFFILSIALVSGSLPAQATMYKWVDETGRVHFGDRLPVQYLDREHYKLNDRGLVVRRNEAAKTPEQKMEAKRLEKERKQTALIVRQKQQRDRVLLDTYTTERDLIVARNARLDAVDAQIQLAHSIIADSTRKISTMKQRVSKIQASNRAVPQALLQNLNSEKKQVAIQSEVRNSHKQRRDNIVVQFNAYIKRFNILKAEQNARREQLARERGL